MAIISRGMLRNYLISQIIRPEDKVKKGSTSETEGEYSTVTKVEQRLSTNSTWIWRIATSGRISCLWRVITVGFFIDDSTNGKEPVVLFKTTRETMKEWAFADSSGKWYLENKDKYDTCLFTELMDEVLSNTDVYPEQLVKTVYELGKVGTSNRDTSSIVREAWGYARSKLQNTISKKDFKAGGYIDRNAKRIANNFNKYIPGVKNPAALEKAIGEFTDKIGSLIADSLGPEVGVPATAILKLIPDKIEGKIIINKVKRVTGGKLGKIVTNKITGKATNSKTSDKPTGGSYGKEFDNTFK